MKTLLLLIIKSYWFFIPEKRRRKCIFRTSCSRYVYKQTNERGIISGIKAFIYRFKNCRTGALLHENPMTGEIQIILPNHQILDEKEISERFKKTK